MLFTKKISRLASCHNIGFIFKLPKGGSRKKRAIIAYSFPITTVPCTEPLKHLLRVCCPRLIPELLFDPKEPQGLESKADDDLRQHGTQKWTWDKTWWRPSCNKLCPSRVQTHCKESKKQMTHCIIMVFKSYPVHILWDKNGLLMTSL